MVYNIIQIHQLFNESKNILNYLSREVFFIDSNVFFFQIKIKLISYMEVESQLI